MRRFTCVHPSGLPLARDPRVEREPFGFALGFAPRSHPRRTPGRGRSTLDTGPDHTVVIDYLQPVRSLTCVRPHVARLPPASPDRCDGPAAKVFHLHSITWRLV